MEKILVGVPYYRYIDPECEVSLRMLDAIDGVDVIRWPCSNIAMGRNELAQKMRVDGYDYLFFLDSDCAIYDGDLELLLAVDKPVVTGLYALLFDDVIKWAVASEHHGDKYVFLTGEPTEPVAVLGAGAGCLLIKREVFAKIEWPWFDFSLCKGGNIRGEDLEFTQKCIDAGIEIWLQPKVFCSHYKKIDITKLIERSHAVRDAVFKLNV